MAQPPRLSANLTYGGDTVFLTVAIPLSVMRPHPPASFHLPQPQSTQSSSTPSVLPPRAPLDSPSVGGASIPSSSTATSSSPTPSSPPTPVVGERIVDPPKPPLHVAAPSLTIASPDDDERLPLAPPPPVAGHRGRKNGLVWGPPNPSWHATRPNVADAVFAWVGPPIRDGSPSRVGRLTLPDRGKEMGLIRSQAAMGCSSPCMWAKVREEGEEVWPEHPDLYTLSGALSDTPRKTSKNPGKYIQVFPDNTLESMISARDYMASCGRKRKTRHGTKEGKAKAETRATKRGEKKKKM